MTRKRRCNRSAQPHKLDQAVVMFGYSQIAGVTDWKQWFYRTVSLRDAIEMIRQGEAEAIQIKTPKNGWVTFYRELKSIRGGRYTSPATLTFATMTAVGNNEPGVQLTRGERAHIEKFTMWPLVGDTKAVAVRPRISDRERIQAERMLDRARGVRPASSAHSFRSRGGDVRTLHISDTAVAHG